MVAKHLMGHVPDNPRAANPSPEELAAMFSDDWLAGTACETCRHRDTIDCGYEVVNGYQRRVEIDVCLATHDNRAGSVNFKLTARYVQDTCPDWEMEE